MQVRSVLAIAIGISTLAAVAAHAAERSPLAGNTGLQINSAPRLDLVTSVPIDYLNRAVANGRRVVSLRVAQPLLCADFAPAPSAAVTASSPSSRFILANSTIKMAFFAANERSSIE